MLSEPPRTQADLHFSLAGIPVRVHPMFWVISLLMGTRSDTPPVFTLIWMGAVFVCILLHELGHAAVMGWFGFSPRIVLHGFGGLATYGPGNRLGRRLGPADEILIDLAGPAAGFLLAAVLFAILRSGGFGEVVLVDPLGAGVRVLPFVVLPQHLYLMVFLNNVFYVSVFWGLINLLPVFPLDGGQIAQQLGSLGSRDSYRQTFVLSFLVAVGMAALALLRWNDWYVALLFGYLAFLNYSMLQRYQGGEPW
ncbi:MAG: site-2 protease family protein [Thermoguttaceae bacterium]|jgi:Zn-dependent protease